MRYIIWNMKYLIILIFAVLGLLMFSSANSFAAGGCPDGATSLEAYAVCLRPMQGKLGMQYRGTRYDLDQDHQELMGAMSRTTAVPPQPWPGTRGIMGTYPTYPVYPVYPVYPSYPAAGIYMAAAGGGSPAIWNYLSIQCAAPMY